jgi:hypothetical protein
LHICPTETLMQQGNDNALRTRVYIDGYNLYYGCLKHSPDKWLDVRALIERILTSILFEQNGEPVRFAFQTPAIKYFTAPILAAFAKSDDSVSCQYHYHTALSAHLGGALKIIKGYHDAKPARWAPLVKRVADRLFCPMSTCPIHPQELFHALDVLPTIHKRIF